MIRILIVDDEPLARERIRIMLSSLEEVEVIGETETGTGAVDSITKEKPDLVLLDINLPDLDGFEVISELAAESVDLPLLIFQTAYDQHAIRAFEVNAIDYLLKPFSRQRLKIAIEKAKALLGKRDEIESKAKVINWLADERERRSEEVTEYLRRVEIRDRGEIFYVPVEEVEYFQADGNYIEVHTGERLHLWRQTLGKLEGKLDPKKFIRISRSAIIPIEKVASIETPVRGEVWVNLLSKGRLALSRNLPELQDLLNSS